MQSSPDFDGYLHRLGAIHGNLPIWSRAVANRKSALLTDLYAEWTVHFLATVETLYNGFSN